MTAQQLSNQTVRRRRWLGQAAAVVFVAGATFVALRGLPGGALDPINTTPRAAPEPPPREAPAEAAEPVRYEWLAGTLNDLGGVEPIEVEVAQVDEPETPDEPIDETPPTPAEKREIRYLGSIVEPGRRVALLNINGRQRFMREGHTTDDIELVEVGADFALLNIGGVERRLDRASRSANVVTEIGASAAGPTGADRNAARDAAAEAARARLHPRERPERRPTSGSQR